MTALVELEVRGIRLGTHREQAAVALVAPRDRSAACALSFFIGAGDAHALGHELGGEETTRSQALQLVSRAVSLLGGRLAAVHLVPTEFGMLTGTLEIETPLGYVSVPAEPGQVLAVAVRLGVPLLGDSSLFASLAPPAAEPLSPMWTGLLESIDLCGLPDPPSV